MDTPLDTLEKLATRARRETAPQGDVLHHVLREARAPDAPMTRPLALFTGAYATVAIVMMAYFLQTGGGVDDPLSSLFQMASLFSL
jgi:hypothetical protein